LIELTVTVNVLIMFKNLTGLTFGKWTVISREPSNKNGTAMWKCLCECGTESVLQGGSLRAGTSTQCHKCSGIIALEKAWKVNQALPKKGILINGKRRYPDKKYPYKKRVGQALLNKRKCQLDLINRRRKDYLQDKSCVVCGATKRLEIDHIDPKTKTSHRIWSWKDSRRIKELKKCQVLCKQCHIDKTCKDLGYKRRKWSQVA
jgi:5-methylcytosine-specific restriction endonuclease McrA